SVQVSSDAAEALGMLAGQPANLAIVALRRQELDMTPAAEVTPETEAAAVAAATATEGAEVADAGAPAAAPAAAPADASGAPATEGAAAMDAAVATDAAATPEPKKKRGLFGGLFKRKPKVEDAVDAPVAGAVTGGPIDEAPLDPVVGAATAGIAAAEAKAADAPATAAAPAPAPAPAPASANLKRPYVQIGIFSTEANAKRAVEQMQKAGLSARSVPDQSNGKTYWRVIVGPASSEADRTAMAGKVKGIGYPDAYPVSK
ncbi:MAG: SPOR domain-containing protein, partial [Albidovulum sp.]